ALLGLALVLVFAVTREIFIPQGEFVAYGALTLAMLVNGRTPGTAWLLVLAGMVVLLMELVRAWRTRLWGGLPRTLLACVVLPLLLFWLTPRIAGADAPLW